jgi:hypothetical protein
MERLPIWLQRALRTAFQAFIPALAGVWAVYAESHALTAEMVWFGVGVPTIAAFIAAFMNRKA